MHLRIQTISIDIRVKAFWTLVSIILLSVGIYFYSMLATVHYTVLRESLVAKNEALVARVSELEFQNIAMKNKIDFDKALSYGFSEVKNPIYISRTQAALTLNTERN